MLLNVALVRTNVSEELSASFIVLHLDEGGAKILRNVGSYKSHTE
jgi:hypothetical protein